jgi:hypothetical protein
MSRIDPAILRANINAVFVAKAQRSHEAQELGRRAKALRVKKERGMAPVPEKRK